MLNILKRKTNKKESASGLRICMKRMDGTPIYTGLAVKIEFPEPLILAKSVEFFKDPEPCYIHRGAVITRLSLELEETLERLFIEAKIISSKSINESLPGYLGSYPEIAQIQKVE